MADNVAITAGTGTTIAADDIGAGVLAQRVKPVWGPDGTGNDIDVATGKPLPVQVRSATGLIPIGEPTDAKSAVTDTTSASLISITKQLSAYLLGGMVAQLGARTIAQSPAVNIATDQGTLPVGQVSQAFDVAVTITRPANVTAYTAVDNVGGALTFASMGPSASAIMITSAQLEADIAAIPTGMTSFRLYLYNITPPSAVVDNGPWDLPSGDRASYLGYIDLGTPADLGATCYCEATNINKQLKLSGTSLFAYLVTAGGFTPAANSEVYKVTLHAVSV